MNGQDLDGTAPQVIISSYENAAAQVRLHDRAIGEYETTFAVALHAGGFDARVSEVSVTPWDGGGLPAFLDGLASDFRGWAGTRSWAVPHLTVTAAYRSGGHVELCWTTRPGTARSDWEGSLTTWVEAGQQMTELAAAVKAFLARAQPAQLRRRRGACSPVPAPSRPSRRPSRAAAARGSPGGRRAGTALLSPRGQPACVVLDTMKPCRPVTRPAARPR